MLRFLIVIIKIIINLIILQIMIRNGYDMLYGVKFPKLIVTHFKII